MFVGDLTDRGTPLEVRFVARVVRAGHPFVFVSGNHDSPGLMRELARRGAIVLTERGRLRARGGRGPVIVRVGGLRVAGYGDPFLRRPEGRFRGEDPQPTDLHQRAFADWLRPLLGRVDVVMVHEPALAEDALAELRRSPPRRPLVVLVGHTHVPSLERDRNLVVLNGGTVGAGGTGNLDERQELGLARLAYARRPAFRPLAADLVALDPGDGTATARRYRLDQPE
jgi:predicted phosphodiesterase